jgi:hypothetical protein
MLASDKNSNASQEFVPLGWHGFCSKNAVTVTYSGKIVSFDEQSSIRRLRADDTSANDSLIQKSKDHAKDDQ